jgi:integrase
VGCALRRQELASLEIDGIQLREGRWVLPDLRGKGGRVRTVAIPVWVKQGINAWMPFITGAVLRGYGNDSKQTWPYLHD